MGKLDLCFALCCSLSLVLARSPQTLNDFKSIRSANSSRVARSVGDSTAVATDLTALQWLVAVVHSAATGTGPADAYGPGVIIHQSWVIAHSDLHETVDARLLKVYANTLTADQTTPDATAIPRKVKERIVHSGDAAGLLIDKLQLLKVCPKYPTANVYTIPATPVALATGDTYKFYNYEPTLWYAEKTIGEDCECQDYIVSPETVATVEPLTFCGAESPTIYLEATDKVGTIAIKGTDFIGINTDFGEGGDIFIEIGQYKTWVDNNAV